MTPNATSRGAPCAVFRRAIVPALLVALAGCGDDPISEFGIQVVTTPATRDFSSMVIDVTAPDGRRTIRRSHFVQEAGVANQWRVPTLTLYENGDLSATVRLGEGASVATSRVEFRIQPDWRYGMTIFLGGSRPQTFCGSVRAATAIPQTAAGDSLFIVTGGIPKNAVC